MERPLSADRARSSFGDLGMRRAARGFDQHDIGKIVENAVYLGLAGASPEPSSTCATPGPR